MGIAGWLLPAWSKAVIPIAVKNTQGDDYKAIGTGFLVKYKDFICVFTAAHVVLEEENEQPRSDLHLLLNMKDGTVGVISLDELAERGVTWIKHNRQDLAVSLCPYSQDMDIKRFTVEAFEDFSGLRQGDDVFFLGFPFGITTQVKVTPVVRGGIIALKREDDTFLIDGNVWNGNSGSPVFFRPCPFYLTPERMKMGKIRPSRLIGIITDCMIVSKRGGDSEWVNISLAEALSVRYISEILDSANFRKMLHGAKEKFLK